MKSKLIILLIIGLVFVSGCDYILKSNENKIEGTNVDGGVVKSYLVAINCDDIKQTQHEVDLLNPYSSQNYILGIIKGNVTIGYTVKDLCEGKDEK